MPQIDTPEGAGAEPSGRTLQYRIAFRTAAVAGLFSLVVCLLLAVDFARRTAKDPLEAPEFLELKAELVENPRDESLKEEIRRLDLELRQRYFRHRTFATWGAYLLLCGVTVMLAASIWATAANWKAPQPDAQPEPQDRETPTAELGRAAVVALAGVLIGAALTLGLTYRTLLPEDPAELAVQVRGETAPEGVQPRQPPITVPDAKLDPFPAAKTGGEAPEAKPALLTDQQRAGAWMRFRGPEGAGISAYDDAPTSWDDKSGEGIVWKTAVPLPGHNSPIVCRDRVFVSGATEDRREVYCFSAADGKLLWQKEAPGTPQSTAKPPELSHDTGYAAPTMTGDGLRVFAMFANGDVACFDLAGELAWSRSLGIPENVYGHAASLEMFENFLLIQFDQANAKAEKSKMLALDAATGETVWEVKRPVPNSWASPVVIQRGARPQLVTTADPWVISYNPKDGQEIWRVKCLSGDVGVSPVFADGVIYVGNEYCKWSAIRADGQGDVTDTHILWTAEEGLPDMCSPLVAGKYLLLLTSYGILTCYDRQSGTMLWDKEFEDAMCTSSPGLAGGRVYLLGEIETDEEDAEGNYIRYSKTWILEPGDEEAKLVGECRLEEGCVTSPAFQPGRIYIRGRKHLFCLGEK